MTKEELEKEADEYADTVKCEWENDTYWVDCRDKVTDAYLAGHKAGRPKWHKTADGDLPTTVGRRFLVSNRYCTMIGYWNGRTFVSTDEDTTEIASPIAWCEIPKYTEE